MNSLERLKHHVTWAIERGEKQPIVAVIKLYCAGSASSSNCPAPCTFIDRKGFVYCETHGRMRKGYTCARKLKPSELKILESGKPLPKY